MHNTKPRTTQCIPCGIHWIIELSGCPFSVLNNSNVLTEAMNAVCDAGNFTRLETVEHTFSPHGVTMLSLLSESHISIHTWPEHGYAAIDIFTCGEPPTEDIFMPILRNALQPTHCDVQALRRGYHPATTKA